MTMRAPWRLRFALLGLLPFVLLALLPAHVLALRKLRPLLTDDDHMLSSLCECSNPDRLMNDFLPKVLVERPVGSPGHRQVQQNLITFFKHTLGYHSERHTFQDRNPFTGQVHNFTNLVFTQNPGAHRHLTIAAHYDSKAKPAGFLGATDSAAPMAIMMDLAWTLDRMVQQSSHRDPSMTLQFVFFDGEEAFEEWRNNDHTYGSRRLAELWADQDPLFAQVNADQPQSVHVAKTRLEQMEVMVLLDLLGASQPFPEIRNFFPGATGSLFEHTAKLERRLWERGSMSFARASDRHFYFVDPKMGGEAGMVEDDHVAFLERGIPIFHWITTPFPSVWHTLQDNRDALVPEIMDDLAKILRVLVFQYLELELDLCGPSNP